jgi:DNA-damage-inducible protein J
MHKNAAIKKASVKKTSGREKSEGQNNVPIRAKGARGKDTQSGTIRARVSPSLKTEVDGILAELGLNASEAIRLFYRQVALRKGLPFLVNIPNATTRKALRDAEADRNMTDYDSVDEMFKDLGI